VAGRDVESGSRWHIAKEGMHGDAREDTAWLWFDRDAEGAARFCAETFPESFVGAVHRAPGDLPSGKKGTSRLSSSP